jgi:hypothetical protein
MAGAAASSIFRVATAYEAAKETQTVEPEKAEGVRALGRARFYDALAGRYGLPGSAFSDPIAARDRPAAETQAGARYDLHAMTVGEVLDLAEELRGGGALDAEAADLLGYRLDALPFAADSVFSASPVADFARSLQRDGSPRGRTTDLIAQQQEQLRYLTENGADPRAIRGAQRVLGQLQLLDAEQALYAQIDSNRRDFRDGGAGSGGGFGGLGPFGALTDTLSFPADALTLFATR